MTDDEKLKAEIALREVDYWLLQAHYFMSKGEGFDHLVQDAFQRAAHFLNEARSV